MEALYLNDGQEAKPAPAESFLETRPNARLGSYCIDVATGKWTCSRVLDELFGIVDITFERDLAGWLQIVHPQERAEMLRYLQDEVLQGRAPFNRAYRIVRLNDQRECWVHGLGKLIVDDSSQVVKMVGIIQDITERKRCDQMLAQERDLLQALMDNLPDYIYFKDIHSRFVRINQAQARHFGLHHPDEAIGKSDADFFPPSEARLKLEAERHLLTTGVPILGLVEQSTAAQGTQWVSSTKVPIRGADGRITGLAGISRDITERKRAEEQMHLQLSTLTAVANAILITDHTGKIEWVNPAFIRLTGYNPEEVIGKNPRLLNSGRHTPSFYAGMWGTILAGKFWHGEIVNRRKDGQLYTADMTITPVQGADGQITHFVAVKQDVTERRSLENRLQQAQKMEAVGTLAGGIAHDFNNMLAAMLGYTNLLERVTRGAPQANEYIAEILAAINRAKELVQQILAFSRKRELNREIIRSDAVVKEVVKFLRASLPANIEIELNLAANSPAMLADPTQIYQVVMNLATNALHAMEGRHGQLAISLEAFQPDEAFIQLHPEFRPIEYVWLEFTDTGCGMDTATMRHIFEPFFTTKPVGKGTGLGLAVVYGIVQAHEGIITVASQVGEGTTFSLFFPACSADATLTNAVKGKPPKGRGQKILLLDDEPALTAPLKRLLAQLNYQVTDSNTPLEAIAWCRENPARFDLVVTDLTMPVMNGLEVARQLHVIRSSLPILLTSGCNVTLTPDMLRDAGISQFLEKPVSIAVLAETIAHALESGAEG